MPQQPTIVTVATVAAHLRSFHLRWARYLRQQGFSVWGVARDISQCPDCRGAFSEVVDIPFSRNSFCPRQLVSAGPALRRLVAVTGARVVHFHTPNAAFWGRLALRSEVLRGRCKVIYTAHGFHFHKSRGAIFNSVYRAAERYAAWYTNALLTINSEDAEEAKRFRFAPGGFHVQLPGAGVDLDRFDPARLDAAGCRSALMGSLNLPGSSKLVLMVAEFAPGKRHRDALRAFAELNRPDTHLLLAGIGDEYEKMTDLARSLDLQNRVHFLGYRKDVPELLAASDLVILTSEREGLPVSVLEAMAMERAVIAADARGSRELVHPGCGWIYPVGDTHRLASKIQEVLSRSDEASRRAQHAREKVRANYGWPAVQENLENVYRRLGLALVESSEASPAGAQTCSRGSHTYPAAVAV